MKAPEERKWISWSFDDFTSWIEERPQRKSALKDVLAFIEAAEIREVSYWPGLYPVVQQGAPSDQMLYILLEGNAFLFQSFEPFKTLSLPGRNGRALKTKLEMGLAKQSGMLWKVGDINPFFLCPGDLIGEYELLGRSPYLDTVIVGLPFYLNGSVPSSLVMRICISQVLRDNVRFRSFIDDRRNRKSLAVLKLLSAKGKRFPEVRLAYILCLCFEGYLPTLQCASPPFVLAPHESGSEATEIHLPNRYLEILCNDRGHGSLKGTPSKPGICAGVENHGFNYQGGTSVHTFKLRDGRSLAAIWADLYRHP